MDRNHDGVVTIDEFLNCCKTDQAITNSMLVFDSTIWPSGGNELEGTIKNTSSLSQKSQKQQNQQQQANQQQQRTTSQAVLKEQQRRRRQQKQHEQPRQHHSQLNDNHINNNHDKTNNHIDNDTKRGRKNKSPSIDKSFKQNGPSTSTNTSNHNNSNILNHKTNNIRNNDCQAKRIQLSSAAKRCKNINRSIVDNNNPNPINDICSYDVKINIPTVSNYQLENLSFTYNSSANDGYRSITPPPLPSTPDSPTLVKVKTWYTQAVAKQGVIFWYWNHIFNVAFVSSFVWCYSVQEEHHNHQTKYYRYTIENCFMFRNKITIKFQHKNKNSFFCYINIHKHLSVMF